MPAPNPKISENSPVIRQLDETAINRIAAGEVVERPASAVKELVENALDAEARRIEIAYADGGKTLIRVTDDGYGIAESDLSLAMSRHATSKIDGSDLLNIHSFGFRGEALPSLGAVGRLTITSRVSDAPAASISVIGGQEKDPRPAALNTGTVVELRGLFFATPARLKFLRTDRAEAQAISDVVKRLAMAEPYVSFILRDLTGGGNGRIVFRADAESGDLFDALHGRLARVLGAEFAENSLRIDANREGLHLTGYAALPTYSRGSSVAQYLFVNGRPVRDRMLYGALRGAYMDFLSRDRHPAAALFINCDPQRVDVNVHPAKAEVRFREPGIARGLIVSGLRQALAEAGHRASTTVAGATLGAMRPQTSEAPRNYQMDRPSSSAFGAMRSTMQSSEAPGLAEAQSGWENAPGTLQVDVPLSGRVEATESPVDPEKPLGAARAQLHENYIVSQTLDGVVIVDQHAAHERLVYEKLKRQMAENDVAAQALLIPEIVELSEGDASRLLDLTEDLGSLGLTIEPFGGGAVAVRETPAILGPVNARAMLLDILDELTDIGDSQMVQTRIEAILSRVACHGSIRSGRRMQADEMNALLREMEATPHSGQCNHGRPTYVELKLICRAETDRHRTTVWAHMIQIGSYSIDFNDPLTQMAVGAGLILSAFLFLLILAVRASARSARNVDQVAQQVGRLNADLQGLGVGQQQLAGNLQTVSETQTNAQVQVIQTMENRLADVQLQMNERLAENARRATHTLAEMQERMKESLHGSSEKTTQSLTQLQERLATIDKAQTNIEKLSGDVLSLQDILSNKQTRGAFGEIQLTDIVSKALPADSYTMQAKLTNGSRPDCLIHLPNPPGPIVVDAKFPLEAYERLRAAGSDWEANEAAKQFRVSVRAHIKAISEKYLIEGETADGALMFLPSEAVYAELHANFAELVREGFAARIWIVSPTTCMATLNTMRAILKDARMREQAGAIRKALKHLHRDVEIIGEKAGKLETHLRQAGEDVSGVLTAATRAGKRADRLDNFDFEELAPDAGEPRVVPLRSTDS